MEMYKELLDRKQRNKEYIEHIAMYIRFILLNQISFWKATRQASALFFLTAPSALLPGPILSDDPRSHAVWTSLAACCGAHAAHHAVKPRR